jgi:YD repeat-containing protein
MRHDLSRRGWLATLIGGLLGYVVPSANASAPKRPTPHRRAAVSRPISSGSEMGRVTVYTYDALGRLTCFRVLPPGSAMPW